VEEDVQVVSKAGEEYAGAKRSGMNSLSSQVIVAVLQLHTHFIKYNDAGINLILFVHGKSRAASV
jgi:hypothetical protein